MIDCVSLAEDYIARNGRAGSAVPSEAKRGSKPTPDCAARARAIAPVLRGAIAFRRNAREIERFVSEFRTSPQILKFVAAENLDDLARRGVSTPDLSIRIKTGPMVLPALDRATSAGYAQIVRDRVAAF